jgi:hypothetical protein
LIVRGKRKDTDTRKSVVIYLQPEPPLSTPNYHF